MIAQPVDAMTVRADQLTEGDIIIHRCTGDAWEVICEPEYTNSGIRFEVLWLEVESPDNTQSVCFAPEWQFELLDHQPVMAV